MNYSLEQNGLVLGLLGCICLGVTASCVHGQEKLLQNPAAVDFSALMQRADQNHDGLVSFQELTAEIGKQGGRSPESIQAIAANILKTADADSDGKLSAAEVKEGAIKTAQKVNKAIDVRRAQALAEALENYKKAHGGALPQKLDELSGQNAFPQCILEDGSEKPWGYTAKGDGENAVVVFSPGAVDAGNEYLVILKDGRVVGMQDKDLKLEKVPGLQMNVFSEKR